MARIKRAGQPLDWIRAALGPSARSLDDALAAADEDLLGAESDEASRLQLAMEILRERGQLDDAAEQAFSEAIDAMIERG